MTKPTKDYAAAEETMNSEMLKLQARIDGYSDANYGWLEEFAQRTYAETRKSGEALDTKADRLITFAAAAIPVAIALAGHAAIGRPLGWLVPALTFLPVLGLLRTIHLALQVLKPRPHYAEPTIEAAFSYVFYHTDRKPELTQAMFATELHRARELQKGLNEEKAELGRRANQSLFQALSLVLFPLLAVVIASLVK